MISVGLQYARLCDVPLAFMSKKQRAKFDYLFDGFVHWPCLNGENIPFWIDLQRFRLMLTPCELEILHWRFWRWSYRMISERLNIPWKDMIARTRMIRQKAVCCGFEWNPRGTYSFAKSGARFGEDDKEALISRLASIWRKSRKLNAARDVDLSDCGLPLVAEDMEAFEIPNESLDWYRNNPIERDYMHDDICSPDLFAPDSTELTGPPGASKQRRRGKG